MDRGRDSAEIVHKFHVVGKTDDRPKGSHEFKFAWGTTRRFQPSQRGPSKDFDEQVRVAALL